MALLSTARGPIQVVDLPLACCGLESSRAALACSPEAGSPEAPIAVALCLSGTVTAKFAPVVQQRIASVRADYPDLPVYVVAVGACAASGGPYWDSPSVQPGVAVDLMVPGCPPAPDAIAAAIAELVRP